MDAPPAPVPSPPPRVPVSIVTGFLGAGKTTLLRHVLTALHGRRVAVIENEFADEVGIESLILKDGLAGPAADGFYELQNGCLCCSTRDELVVVLEKLMARSRERRFDCVLVETSGLANPGPVAAAFWHDVGDLDAQLELDGVITVVDAAHVMRQLDGAGAGRREAEQQIACADVVLLNKCDLVGGPERTAVRSRLLAMNATARIVECERADVAMDAILGLRAFDLTRPGAAETAPPACADGGCQDRGHGHSHSSHGGPALPTSLECLHDDSIRTITLRCAQPVSARRVTRWMGSLLWAADAPADAGADRPEVLRGKGVLCVQEPDLAEASEPAAASPSLSSAVRCSPLRHILQSVHEQFDLQAAQGEGSRWAVHELPAESRVVLIGRRLDEASLSRSFASCAEVAL